MDVSDSNELWLLALVIVSFTIMGILVVYGVMGMVTIVIQILNHQHVHISSLEFAGIVFIITMLIFRPQIKFDVRK